MNHSVSISIVTSCRNAEKYIGDTIRSVNSHGYPHLQYIVIDGASTDATYEIVKSHRKDLSIALSEPDNGQYHGIQKGLEMCDGEVMAYLNADDMYCPWTLKTVAEIFAAYPQVEWITGQPAYLNAAGHCTRVSSNPAAAYPRRYIQNGWYRETLTGYLQQESMFWRRSLWEKAGGLNLSYAYAADFELWTRFALYANLYAVAAPLALFRKLPGEQKSSVAKRQYEEEVEAICAGFEKPFWPWRYLAGRSTFLNYFIRLLIWKKCGVIAYSENKGAWVFKSGVRRPIARFSMTEALLQHGI